MSQDPFELLDVHRPERYLEVALAEARQAFDRGEVPVGAVIVDRQSGNIVAKAHNQREMLRDPTAHAEIIAITQAAAHYDAWRLIDCDLYVTLEPCIMCAGAIVQARIPRVTYGAEDPKAGAHCSVFNVLVNKANNHVPEVIGGVRADESAELLREFFRRRRKNSGGVGNGAGDGNGNGSGSIC